MIDCPQNIYKEYLNTISGIKFTAREIDVISCIIHGRDAKGIANFYLLQIDLRKF